MSPPMNRSLGRRLVALVTAYALALNALLPVLLAVGPQPAEAAPAIICGSGGTSPASPARQHQECPGACLMAGCAGSALPGGEPEFSFAVAWVAIGAVLSRPDPGLKALHSGRSWFARGPPIA